jgi:hypothetical protein
VGHPLDAGRHPGGLERLAQLVAGELGSVLEGFRDRGARTPDGLLVQPELTIAVAHRRPNPGSSELDHPPDVGGPDEMPCGSEDVGPKDFAFVEGLLDGVVGRRLRPRPQRPLGGGVVLGLHGAEPLHHVARPSERGSAQALVGESQVGDVQTVQAGIRMRVARFV